jgi:hypothetical protein
MEMIEMRPEMAELLDQSEGYLVDILLNRTPIGELSELLTELNRDRLVSDIMDHGIGPVSKAMERLGMLGQPGHEETEEQRNRRLDIDTYHAKTLANIRLSESGDDEDGEADAESGEG